MDVANTEIEVVVTYAAHRRFDRGPAGSGKPRLPNLLRVSSVGAHLRSVRTLFSVECIHSLRVLFLLVLLPFIRQSSLPTPTFVNQLVRYSLSLIYKGIRLYSRVTN